MTALFLLAAVLTQPPAVHATPIQASPVIVTISPRKGTKRLTCAVDGAAARTCKRRASFRLGPGRHTVAVRALYEHATSAAATVSVLVPQPAPVPVRVGGEPVGIAASGDSVWVSGGTSGDVARIDASTRTVAAVVHTDGALGGLAAGGNTVWVSDFGGGRVLRIENGAVTAHVDVGGQPTGISLSTDGSVWVGNLNGYVSRINPATNALAATIALPSGASMPFFARGLVWVGLQNGSVVSVDPATNQITGTAIGVASDVDALADSASGLWVSTFDGSAALLDPSARSVLRRHKLPGRGSGVTVAAGSAWLSDYDDNLVVQLDAQSGELLGAVRTGRRPRESVAAGNSLWVLDQSDGAVTPIPLPGASPRPAR